MVYKPRVEHQNSIGPFYVCKTEQARALNIRVLTVTIREGQSRPRQSIHKIKLITTGLSKYSEQRYTWAASNGKYQRNSRSDKSPQWHAGKRSLRYAPS